MKKLLSVILYLAVPLLALAEGWPANYGGVMMQGFYWDSYSDSKWSVLTSKADLYSQYFDLIWVPNSGNCQSTYSMGYMPIWWFNNSSSFGNETELRKMIATYKANGTGIIEDVVINHKNGKSSWCDFPNETWNGNSITWTMADICRNDECANNGYKPTGAYDTGDNFDGCRDLDHTSANVQKNVKLYLSYLLTDLGYAGFRYDMVKGYGATYTKMYNQSAKPKFSVGEYWDGDYNAVVNWIKGTGYESAAFDFPLKYVINSAFGGNNWSALNNKGIAGDPNNNRYAVTFVDNHDTYRNNDKLSNNVVAANAFILALPGTPCVFLPHFQAYGTEIGKMILARKAAGITNQSSITSQGTQGGGYVMKVKGSKGSVMVILGYVSNADTNGFQLVSTGTNYAYYVSDGVEVGTGSGTGGGEAKDITVHISASKAPYLYAWSGADQMLSSEWPGDKLSKTTTTSDGKTWYTSTYTASSVNLVINDGAGNQTADILGLTDDVYLVYDGTTGYTNVTDAYSGGSGTSGDQLPECATYLDGKLFCYFEGNATYSSPNAWIWNEKGNFTGGTWPGAALTNVGKAASGNTVWLWDGGTLDEANLPTGVVFSTGSGTPQTSDFSFTNGGYYNLMGLVGTVKKQSALKGDVNGDGEVNSSDVSALVSLILSDGTVDLAIADVNGDGEVNSSDVSALVSMILGK